MNYRDKYSKRIIVTGGAGFIGSNFLLDMVPKYRDYLFVNVDCLSYAANLENLHTIETEENYRFEKVDICDIGKLGEVFEKYDIDSVIHLAAETHVDRSIMSPSEFIDVNIKGVFNLLELARKKDDGFRFHHVSTDEVYGSLGETGYFTEESPYNPQSPYAASKASADHLVRSYHNTYKLDAVVSNCSNNFGPYQFPEKLIPLTIMNALNGKDIPIYGDGGNVRDWLFVTDHCRALDIIFHKGKAGKTYNIGGNHEFTNLDLVKKICGILSELTNTDDFIKQVKFVGDRPGHDRRYAIDSTKLQGQLGWSGLYGDSSVKYPVSPSEP